MQINRLVHPGFWFGKTKVEDALKLARLGVGGFCFYGGTRKQVAELTRALRAQSPLPKILISADYEDGVNQVSVANKSCGFLKSFKKYFFR